MHHLQTTTRLLIAQRSLKAVVSTRPYSSTASNTTNQINSEPVPQQTPTKVLSGIILSRTPIVTPTLSPFEEAYYKYQDELEKRLMWTFPQHYYFKKGSLAERKFVKHQRGPVAKQPGVFYPRGVPDVKFNRERRFKQEIVVPREGGDEGGNVEESSFTKPIEPNSRITEADEKGDVRSLARKLDRTLYLVIKDAKAGTWKLPAFKINVKEYLHDAAERGLRELGGPNMNTWTVSNTPSAVVKYDGEDPQHKEFFIKSHILDGQFVPQDKSIDFAWLTKEEIQTYVDKSYFETLEPVFGNL